jgi:hypothetical protein
MMRIARARFVALSLICGIAAGCGLRAAVSVKFAIAAGTPRDASVFVDEEFIGLLDYVAAHGVRLPEGEHRLSVERDGYYPLDQLLVSDREPIAVRVQLTPIPD